ncbi:MAG: PH domain-containing protein [Moheibacter sp.]
MQKKYPSKVSYGLLIFIFLIFFGPLIWDFANGRAEGKSIGLLIFISLIFLFVLHLFFGTVYTIENDILKIKSGFFKFKPIPVSKIKEVSKTSIILSSPAPSFDRILIKYGKFDEIILSPKDKFKFTKDLKQINPDIVDKVNPVPEN